MIKSKQILKLIFATGLFYLFTYYGSTVKEDFQWYDVPNMVLIGVSAALIFVDIVIEKLRS